jgi:hypothetical protein
MMKASGILILIGLTWYLVCGLVRWRCRDKNNFPTSLSFWANLVGPVGCLLCCALALIIMILALSR